MTNPLSVEELNAICCVKDNRFDDSRKYWTKEKIIALKAAALKGIEAERIARENRLAIELHDALRNASTPGKAEATQDTGKDCICGTIEDGVSIERIIRRNCPIHGTASPSEDRGLRDARPPDDATIKAWEAAASAITEMLARSLDLGAKHFEQLTKAKAENERLRKALGSIAYPCGLGHDVDDPDNWAMRLARAALSAK